MGAGVREGVVARGVGGKGGSSGMVVWRTYSCKEGKRRVSYAEYISQTTQCFAT